MSTSSEKTVEHGPIVSWGEVLWDRYPHGDELGGAPANVAFHLARLGAKAALVTRVGDDDDGRRALDGLARAGVDVAMAQVDGERQTGEVGVTIDERGDAHYVLHPGRAWERIECSPSAAAFVGGAAGLCYGTLAQRTDDGRSAHRLAIAAARAGDATRICDPNLRRGFTDWDLLREALATATAIKINEDEARVIERELGCANAVSYLLGDLDTDVVALTRGDRGCAIITASGETADHPGFPSPSGGDNLGCGDAFTAVLAIGLIRKWPLATIARRANRHASWVAGHRGATPRETPPAFE